MDLFDLSNFQFTSSLDVPIYLLSSLYELYGIFQNVSSTYSEDGHLVENGIKLNCSRSSPATEYAEYAIGIYYVICIIIFSNMVKRVSYKQNNCNGKPGLVLPMNMLNSQNYIIEYTLVFLSLSEEIYSYIFGSKVEVGQQIPVVKFFIKLFIVIMFSILSFPIFAAITNRHLLGYVVIMLAAVAYFFVGVSATYTYCFCLVGVKIVPFLFAAVLYSSIDISIVGMFVWKIVCHVRVNGFKNREFQCKLSRNWKYSKIYVRKLLNENSRLKSPKTEEQSEDKAEELNFIVSHFKCDEMKSKMKEKIYRPIPGFGFPPRLIIGMFVGLYFAYRIFIDNILALTPVAWKLLNEINSKYLTTQTNISRSFFLIWSNYSLYSKFEIQNSFRYLTFSYTHLLISCLLLAIFIAFVNSIIQSLLLLRNYRLHFHRITRKGFSTFIDIKRAPPPYSLILGYVRFSGYQAAYTLWGILVVTFFMFILLYFLIGVFLLPLFYVEDSWPRRLLINYGPVLMLSIIFNIIQTTIVKYVFVMEKGTVMEVNNRRSFMIYTHCAFFLNAMMGIFNSVKRVIIWIFSGAFCFSRIDFSSLPEYLHGFDSGYMAYVGFLYTEQYHFNPILQCFTNILVDTKRQTNILVKEDQIDLINNPKGRTRFRNLWYVAVTLINNHQLLAERKGFLQNSIVFD